VKDLLFLTRIFIFLLSPMPLLRLILLLLFYLNPRIADVRSTFLLFFLFFSFFEKKRKNKRKVESG
ncbi:hypothetical protein M569_00362, partial [Genlisea aurea]